jgi:hypothetical protein
MLTTGFFHCRFWVKSRKRDPYSMIYAYFAAVTKNRTLEEIAQISGSKMKQTSFGNGTGTNKNVHAHFAT